MCFISTSLVLLDQVLKNEYVITCLQVSTSFSEYSPQAFSILMIIDDLEKFTLLEIKKRSLRGRKRAGITTKNRAAAATPEFDGERHRFAEQPV